MKAMGIPIWAARSGSAYNDCQPIDMASKQVEPEQRQASSVLNIIDSLSASNVPVLSPLKTVASPQSAPSKIISASNKVESLEWDEIQATVNQCQYCDIHRFRSQAVFGSGDISASWMFIGEAPDVEEDVKAQPFLGKAGGLLDNILAAIDLSRESVYLANIIKCRPPNDRDPHVDEVTNCMGYLQRQIELVQPKVIVVVGRLAAQQLLQTKESIGRMRGRVHHLAKTNTPVIVTYHPRYLLRQASEKRKVWEDIKLARSIVQS